MLWILALAVAVAVVARSGAKGLQTIPAEPAAPDVNIPAEPFVDRTPEFGCRLATIAPWDPNGVEPGWYYYGGPSWPPPPNTIIGRGWWRGPWEDEERARLACRRGEV